MAIRKSGSYSKMKVVPYTRTSKKKSKAFIKAVPPSKIVKFEMGNLNDFHLGKFPLALDLVAVERAQIRNNALEACRQYINKKLDENLAGQYYYKVIIYPHHVQRENKMLTGAGADRMQTGMQLSFGKAIAKAALVKKGTKIFTICVAGEKGVLLTRKLLNQIKPKLPCKTRVDFRDDSKKI
jgi:large subunit ribosomal protein L10e